MSIDPEKLFEARQAGFSDEEILQRIAQKFPESAPRIQTAQQAGFSQREILDRFGSPEAQPAPEGEEKEKPVRRGRFGNILPDDFQSHPPMSGARPIGQVIQGLTEGLGGLPASFRDIAKGLDAFTKEHLPQPPAFLQGSGDNFVKKFLRELIEKAPTSEEIRESREKANPASAPRGSFEKILRKGGEFSGASIPFGVSQLIPGFVGGASSEAVKEAGGGPVLQFLGSVAGGITAGKVQSYIANPRTAKSFTKELFKGMDEKIKPGELVDGRGLRHGLNEIITDIEKGVIDSTERVPRNIAQKVLRKVGSGGEVELKSLERIYRNINNELTAFGIEPNKKRLLNQVKNQVSNAIQGHAEKNPEFVQLFNQSNEAFSAISNSSIFSKVIPKKFKLNEFAPESLVLFGLFPPSVATVGKAALANQLITITQRIRQSPVLRGFYLDLLKEAQGTNAANTFNAMRKLDEALKQEKEKGAFEDVLQQ